MLMLLKYQQLIQLDISYIIIAMTTYNIIKIHLLLETHF